MVYKHNNQSLLHRPGLFTPSEHVTAVNVCYFSSDDVLLLKSPLLVVVNPESELNVRPHLISSLSQSIEPFQIKVSSEFTMTVR